jgi:hypothetical protein
MVHRGFIWKSSLPYPVFPIGYWCYFLHQVSSNFIDFSYKKIFSIYKCGIMHNFSQKLQVTFKLESDFMEME